MQQFTQGEDWQTIIYSPYHIPQDSSPTSSFYISLNNLIEKEKYSDVKYGIKLGNKNIGFNGKFYTFPYFLTFLLKRFLNSRQNIGIL